MEGEGEPFESVDGSETQIPKNTKRNTKWSLTAWNEWADKRNRENSDRMVPQLENLLSLPDDEIQEVLCLFVNEIRKTNGTEFQRDTYSSIIYGIQRFLRQHTGSNVNFFDKNSDRFKTFQKVYFKKIVESIGMGAVKKQARIITVEQESFLWEKGIFNMHTCLGISHAVFFYTAKCFGLVSGEGHRSLRRNSFKFGEDDVGKYVQVDNCFIKSSSCRNTKREGHIRQYLNPDNPRSYYNIVKQYLEMCPATGNGDFYIRPSSGSGFSNNAVGENSLQTKVSAIMTAAGFKEHYCNQSIMTTIADRLNTRGFNINMIKHSTGLLSHQHKEISIALDSPMPNKEPWMQYEYGQTENPYPVSLIKVESHDPEYSSMLKTVTSSVGLVSSEFSSAPTVFTHTASVPSQSSVLLSVPSMPVPQKFTIPEVSGSPSQLVFKSNPAHQLNQPLAKYLILPPGVTPTVVQNANQNTQNNLQTVNLMPTTGVNNQPQKTSTAVKRKGDNSVDELDTKRHTSSVPMKQVATSSTEVLSPDDGCLSLCKIPSSSESTNKARTGTPLQQNSCHHVSTHETDEVHSESSFNDACATFTNTAKFKFEYLSSNKGSVSQQVCVTDKNQTVFSSTSTHKAGRSIPDFDLSLDDYLPSDCFLRPGDITIKRQTTAEGNRIILSINYRKLLDDTQVSE